MSNNSNNEREKRARLSHACDRCRKRHVKCDGDYPICGNCKSVNGDCSYSHPGSKRGYVETIDDRLSKIEQVLSKYLEGTDTQQQNSNAASTSDNHNDDPELGVHDIVNMAASLRIKEDHEAIQTLSDSISPATMKSNSRYVTAKKAELDSNYNLLSSGMDLKDNGKGQTTLEPPLPTEYKGSKELPPKDLSEHLIDLYLYYGYSAKTPIIHKPTFIKQLKDKNNQPSLLLLNSIYALSSIFSDDTRTRTISDSPETSGDIFWNRALTLLDDFMDRARLSTVQAILILIHFCVKSTRNTTRIWMLIGTTMRMSIDLGLHRDCSKWNISKIEKAMRTRVFWAVMNAEIIVCASFGKSFPIYDYNTKFPYEIEEDGEEAQDVVNFMHLSKLMKIYGNVLQSKSYFSQPGALRNTLPAIDAILNSWLLALPPHLQYNSPSVGDPDPNSISIFCAYLHQLYNTVVISLHRPYIEDSDEYPTIDSREICNRAAANITKLSNCIHVDSHAVYYTFGLSSYFLSQAATIHALNVGDPEYSYVGKKYMEKSLEALRKMVQTAKLGSTCGVEDATKMLDYLYQDSSDGDSIMSPIVKTESLLNRSHHQQQSFSTASPSGPSEPSLPRKSLGVEHLHYQQQQAHHHQQNGDLMTDHHYMVEMPPPIVLTSLAEPPVVPSSGYYGTNNFNHNMIEFTQSSNQIYLGDWGDMVGVGNSHQIPTSVSSPSPVAMNQNQTNESVGTLSVIRNPTSPSHPNSSANSTSIHQDQSSNYLSYSMNGNHNTILLNNNHAVMGSGAVQNLVNGPNTNMNENNIENNVSSSQRPIMVQQPQQHHPMVAQPTNHSQSFPNAASHLWVQQQW